MAGNYYYIRDNGSTTGTAVGGTIDNGDGVYSSEKSGSWATAMPTAAEFFPDIAAAVASAAGAPSDGDFIIYADDHDRSSALSAIQLNSGGTATGAGIAVYSVSISDVTQYSPGAKEIGTNSSNDITLNYNGHIAGVSFGMGDDTFQTASNVRKWYFQDMTIWVSGVSDGAFKCNQDTLWADLTNVTVNMGAVGCLLFESTGCGNGLKFNWRGGGLAGTAPTEMLSANAGANGGFHIRFEGCDFSSFQGALARFNSTAAACDTAVYQYIGCDLHASAGTGTFNNYHQRLEIFGGYGGVQHGFLIKDYTGTAEHDDAVYVTNDTAWYEGSTKSSVKVVTTANCSHTYPFIFEISAAYVDFGDAGSDVLTLEAVSATSGLQNNDIAAFLMYPDAADVTVMNHVTSGLTRGAGNYGIDPKSTSGNALGAGALGAGDWTGEPGSPSFYKMTLDTTGDAGEAAVARVRIEVYKPSLTIYISPKLRAA